MQVPPRLHPQAVSRRSLVYLHGFASSPRSSKARLFGERAAAAGIPFACPDLNAPDFRTLTVSRMIDQIDRAIDALADGPVALVGSSLGAFVALHAAARRAQKAGDDHPIDRLIFLAPAFDLVAGFEREVGAERIREWEASDVYPVFHYAENRPRELGWAFMRDARAYDPYTVSLAVPTLIYQGRRDEVVAPEGVERWAAARPWVTLRLVDDGHQLLDHVDEMWSEVRRIVEGDA
jgi:pimeloyl-ACP methyl ester carboxylesterase